MKQTSPFSQFARPFLTVDRLPFPEYSWPDLGLAGNDFWTEWTFPFKIGRYELTAHLANGGQSRVFQAWDPLLQRDVAIKVARFRFEHALLSFSRIAQEGALLARLDHPGIVRIYDTGTDRGFPYLVTELIQGQTLQAAFADSRPAARQMRTILVQIAEALSAAHRQGILHLDLKPENVLITPQGECKLIDFGMGWLLKTKAGPPLVFAAGTRQYMAPEQRTGQTDQWTPATDLYGLGAILHFLQTGSPPSSSSAPLPAPVPWRTDFRWISLPAALSEIQKTALAAEIHERYENAEQVLNILRQVRFLRMAGVLTCLMTAFLLLVATLRH